MVGRAVILTAPTRRLPRARCGWWSTGVSAVGVTGEPALRDVSLDGAGRRDPGHRRRERQRPARAGRGHRRAAPGDRRARRAGWAWTITQLVAAASAPAAGHGLHPRRAHARRHRPGVYRRREPDAATITCAPPYSNGFFLDFGAIAARSTRTGARFSIRTPSIETPPGVSPAATSRR